MSELPPPRRAHKISPDGQFVLDLLGHRWMPRIMWELGPGAQSFGELRRRCNAMSTSVLTQRLRDLADAGLAQTDEFGAWELTKSGEHIAGQLNTIIVTRSTPPPET